MVILFNSVLKDEVVLSPSCAFLLYSTGHLVLHDKLQVGVDGLSLGPDHLPVTELRHMHKILKIDGLLLNSNGILVISNIDLLITSIVKVGVISILLDDLPVSSEIAFRGAVAH